MLTKAGDALESAFQTWNNRRHWNTLKDSTTFATVAPISQVCITTVNSTSIQVTDGSVLVVDDEVSGAGILPGTYVTVIAGVTVTISLAATATGTPTLTFARRDYTIPTAFKYIYNVRNRTTEAIIWPIDSRLLDRVLPEQAQHDEPTVYDQFPLGKTGKIRFIPTPIGVYAIEVKYHRRMTVPSVDGTALDIPIDWEWGLIAEAKSIFLTEKGGYDGPAAFWAGKAQNAYDEAVRADNKQLDAVFGFMPADFSQALYSPGNSIATTDFDD